MTTTSTTTKAMQPRSPQLQQLSGASSSSQEDSDLVAKFATLIALALTWIVFMTKVAVISEIPNSKMCNVECVFF